MKINQIKDIFIQSINDYHITDSIYAEIKNPYALNTFESLLYKMNWIHNIQWHLEDLIRDPAIQPEEALQLKRQIDIRNQERTDLVELVDEYYLNLFKNIVAQENASINTESPAWALDRLSILELKIYHMREEVNRKNVPSEHITKCSTKLEILSLQNQDLSSAIQNLLDEFKKGSKYMKVYKQMKMYNDPTLNPVLYGNKA